MNDVPLLVLSALLSLLVSFITSWVSARLAHDRWKAERLSSTRDEAYRELTRASYRFVRTIGDESDEELEGGTPDLELVKETHAHFNDAMYMLSTVAADESMARIDNAYNIMRERALAIDFADPALKTTGTKAGIEAQLAMQRFLETVSDEMRKHIQE